MKIILLRHGIAEDVAPDGTDASRRLTPQGVERTTQAMRGLASVIGTPDQILTSPKHRAMQTADLLAQASGYTQTPALTPILAQDSPQAIARCLRLMASETVVAVGHEPTLSMTAALLCFGDSQLDVFQLKKAGAIGLETFTADPALPDGCRLLWSLPPSVLRGLA